MKYPKYAKELEQLLETDQMVWKSFWAENYTQQGTPEFKIKLEQIRNSQNGRAMRVLYILDDIKLPTIGNIGTKAAQAMSIIALHDKLKVLKIILSTFQESYEIDREDTYYQAIPSMTDRVLILERKAQRYGTQWEGNGLSEPFLPTVEDFENVNERRSQYGIVPLRWPKSLAIPEDEQPWLKKPISELVMRDISDEEFRDKYQEYLQ
jgi:hypothetical protein